MSPKPDGATSLMEPDVLALFTEQVRLAPTRPAAKDGVRELDYAGLEAEVADVAAGLAGLGVAVGDRVALHLHNSVDFVVASLACLWVGAVFVPLATSDPDARVGTIISDCDPVLVLVPEEPGSTSLPPGRRSLTVSALRRLGHDGPGVAPVTIDRPRETAAYAIYTSGTTGTPKGVVIGRRAFTVAVTATVELLGLGPETRALCVSPFHFDGSFGTVFPTIAAGGSLVIPPRESLLFPQRFFKAIRAEHITNTGFSPSYLRLLLASPLLPGLADTSLRTIALGGEACSAADVEALWSQAPNLRVFNRYGPTETTIAVTHLELTREMVVPPQPVPIGRPHPEVDFYLLDEQGVLVVDPGVPGELYIGGEQLMLGYWGDAALTAEVIRTDVIPGARVYRTGDIVTRDRFGDYLYVDRANRVVKRSGVRISLVEIAEALQQVPAVIAAVCVPYDDRGHLGIAAFVVASGPLTPVEIRRSAGELLPVTMLPDRLHVVDTLPLTTSGKVDDRRLLAGAGLGTT